MIEVTASGKRVQILCVNSVNPEQTVYIGLGLAWML